MRIFLALLALVSPVVIAQSIQPGGYLDTLRAGHLLGKVTTALCLAFTALCLAFIELALLPALVRYRLRGIRADRESEAAAAAAAIAPPSLRIGARAGWSDAPTFRTAVGQTDQDGESMPNDRRPPDLFLELDSHLTIPVVPVQLTWRAPGAEVVRISVLPGEHLASGQAAVTLLTTGDITVMASNAHGSRTERTALVRVLPMPTMTRLALPMPPGVTLGAAVDVSLDWGEPVLARLDAVLDEHERQRLARIPELPEHLTLAHLASGLRIPMDGLRGWRPQSPLWLTRQVGKSDDNGSAALQRATRRLGNQGRTTWSVLRARTARPERPAPEFQPGVLVPLPATRNVNVVAAPANSGAAYDHVTVDHVTVDHTTWLSSNPDGRPR